MSAFKALSFPFDPGGLPVSKSRVLASKNGRTVEFLPVQETAFPKKDAAQHMLSGLLLSAGRTELIKSSKLESFPPLLPDPFSFFHTTNLLFPHCLLVTHAILQRHNIQKPHHMCPPVRLGVPSLKLLQAAHMQAVIASLRRMEALRAEEEAQSQALAYASNDCREMILVSLSGPEPSPQERARIDACRRAVDFAESIKNLVVELRPGMAAHKGVLEQISALLFFVRVWCLSFRKFAATRTYVNYRPWEHFKSFDANESRSPAYCLGEILQHQVRTDDEFRDMITYALDNSPCWEGLMLFGEAVEVVEIVNRAILRLRGALYEGYLKDLYYPEWVICRNLFNFLIDWRRCFLRFHGQGYQLAPRAILPPSLGGPHPGFSEEPASDMPASPTSPVYSLWEISSADLSLDGTQ
ncbi:hypothetical protein GX51_08276 [Blastomyces parvus]|uniref:Uncharacterized protein n=1 Tax=Blastomyces parvus TaxID=2060905 RepID=A0A2B7WFM7_9EURO|nr:hypothetical protein GX51_08276 [Blastomyces parvus]